MTPERQRLKIAEACGYVAEQWASSGSWYLSKNGERCHHPLDSTGTKESAFEQHAPDYLSDLNAMHEAEKVLKPDKRRWQRYLSALGRLCGVTSIRCDGDDYPDFSVAVDATAAQRAEAFLKALNLWEDEGLTA